MKLKMVKVEIKEVIEAKKEILKRMRKKVLKKNKSTSLFDVSI